MDGGKLCWQSLGVFIWGKSNLVGGGTRFSFHLAHSWVWYHNLCIKRNAEITRLVRSGNWGHVIL